MARRPGNGSRSSARPWAPLAALVALTLAATAVRVALVPVPGHDGDVTVIAAWAERMAEVGPTRFYEGSGAIYPALLYPLWLLGVTLDGDALRTAIKGLSIPFDAALLLLLYAGFAPTVGRWRAVSIAALYALNPAVLLAGAVWGQVDAAGTLAIVAAALLSARRRDGWAGALTVVAGMVKPQFGFTAVPVLVVAAVRARRDRSWRPVGAFIAGAMIAYVVVAGPLLLHPPRYVGLLLDTATYQPFTSLNAFNPWGLLVGFKVPDEPYVGLGSALLLAGVTASVVGLRRGLDAWRIFAVLALVSLAFYVLPTRVHERYLFPAIALLAPFAVTALPRLWAYVGLTIGFAASLLYALHQTTSFELPATVADPITSPAGVWAIGAALIGSVAAWTWLLLVRDPRPPPPEARPRDRAA